MGLIIRILLIRLTYRFIYLLYIFKDYDDIDLVRIDELYHVSEFDLIV